jgi:uncharacterized protein YcgI (DUF1989 family)
MSVDTHEIHSAVPINREEGRHQDQFMKEYIVQSMTGMYLHLSAGETLRVIDIEGEQVVDFFAVNEMNAAEILSPGVTIDCNGSLKITTGDVLYSSLYNEMFEIMGDTVGSHDLIHPCCRPEMYDHFYNNGSNHPNCLDNINTMLEKTGLPTHAMITPFNIFMNTNIDEDGTVRVQTPKSKPGDYLELSALMNVHAFLSACSVSESRCNGGRCTPIKAVVSE